MDKILELVKEIKVKCPYCDKVSHVWSKLYVEKNSKLERIKKIQIAWCESSNKYVLSHPLKGDINENSGKE